MKKKLVLWILLIVSALSLAACGGNKQADYTVQMADIADCYVGDTVTLPSVTVLAADGKDAQIEISFTVTDPAGKAVEVTDKTFTVTTVGEYTVKATAGQAYAEKKFSVTKQKMAAVTDLSVNVAGVLTFTQKADETYTLYKGETSLGAVQSGANVLDKLSEGNNVFTVVTDAKGDKDASVKSNEAVLEKLAKVTDLSVNDEFDITFTEASGVTYTFCINGGEGVDLMSGDNISEYLHLGSNTVTVLPTKYGAVSGEVSAEFTVSVNNYLPVKDLTVADGVIHFTEEDEHTYSLYINGNKAGAVTNGAEVETYLTDEHQLTTVNVQVQVDGDDNYGASRLGNVATYYYNKGKLGRIAYDGSSRIKDSYSKITDISNVTEDDVDFMHFVATPAADSIRYASVKFDTPMAVDTSNANAVNYLRIVVRSCPDSEIIDEGEWFGLNRSSVGVYGTDLICHLYDNFYRGKVGTSESKWYAVEIQLTAATTQVEGIYIEIAQSDGYRKTYLDVQKCEIVSYSKVETSLGDVETAAYNSLGKDTVSYWSVPYCAAEIDEEVTVGDNTYNSYVKLSRPYEVSSGGNKSFGDEGTTKVGALLKYDFEEALKDTAYSYNNVKVSITLKSERSIVVTGYYGNTLSKADPIEVTGNWQTVEVTLDANKLAGLAFVSVNNIIVGNKGRCSQAPEICIAAISVEALPAAPKVSNLKVDKDGKVTFTAVEGFEYKILDGDGEVLVDNAVSGTSTVTITNGTNKFVVRTIDPNGEYGYTDSDAVVMYKSAFGIAAPYTGSSVNAVTDYSEETVDGKATLKIACGAISEGQWGAELLLDTPITPVDGKINYVKVTFKTPPMFNRINLMTLGINGQSSYLAYYAYGNYDEQWVTGYMQLPANVNAVESVYFKFMGVNSNRNSYLYLASVELESFDTEIDTELGKWEVAAQGTFGCTMTTWAVPYHVSEDAEQSVTVGSNQYTGVVTLTDIECSFGSISSGAHTNPGSFNTGALLKYTTDSEQASITIKIAVKISAGSYIAIAGYYGTTVDRTTYFVGTGEWQEIEITVNTANLQGITFVSINQLNDTLVYPTLPSTVEIADISVAD